MKTGIDKDADNFAMRTIAKVYRAVEDALAKRWMSVKDLVAQPEIADLVPDTWGERQRHISVVVHNMHRVGAVKKRGYASATEWRLVSDSFDWRSGIKHRSTNLYQELRHMSMGTRLKMKESLAESDSSERRSLTEEIVEAIRDDEPQPEAWTPTPTRGEASPEAEPVEPTQPEAPVAPVAPKVTRERFVRKEGGDASPPRQPNPTMLMVLLGEVTIYKRDPNAKFDLRVTGDGKFEIVIG